MADRLTFELVSPERILLSGDYDMVVVPGVEGDFAVLPSHAPLISTLRPGVIEVYSGDRVETEIFVDGGFAQVVADRLVILAERAFPASELDENRMLDLIKEAKAAAADMSEDELVRKAQERVDVLELIYETRVH
ncbi:ATP synthase F1 subunit epsilon [Oceanibacterium hippocampi]|uniref:ATP synthase epsilon chain n=1 Tax=Oceanibacterium hippocampi TaxID=745714 RepID=A0A1Y5RBK3_9PROT|nr:ATP synthase F1 subunit epsilon [Oceanibacterium hippocampi]SLN13542.1 ATP synthase epsilon chain [Oceanibacterium hippocampi]